MYIPSSFAESDLTTLHDLIEHNSFALLVTQHNREPFATHLPLLLDRSSGTYGALHGHMARANPQWEQFRNQTCLAVFSGPHAYISPTWYETAKLVPTWNYAAVHVYGTVEPIDDREWLLRILRRSVEKYERSMPQPWEFGEDEVHIERLLKQIVGFHFQIERIEGTWKLNQHHPAERREKVVRSLESQGGENGVAVAGLMRGQLPETSFSDAELLAAFEGGTISQQQWNHRAHVRVGYTLVAQSGLDDAITRMRAGLMRMSARWETPNTLMRGYHETVTNAWLRLIATRMSRSPSIRSSAEFCEAHGELFDVSFLLQYYSHDRLWSWEAKRRFVEPDLKSWD